MDKKAELKEEIKRRLNGNDAIEHIYYYHADYHALKEGKVIVISKEEAQLYLNSGCRVWYMVEGPETPELPLELYRLKAPQLVVVQGPGPGLIKTLMDVFIQCDQRQGDPNKITGINYIVP